MQTGHLNNVKFNPDGSFQFIDLVTLRPFGPWSWQAEDINESTITGGIARCFDPSEPFELAYLLAGDLSADPDERDISNLRAEGVTALDQFLETEVRKLMDADGRKLIQWMSSQLNETSKTRALITAYIAEDNGIRRQYIDIRTPAMGRKIVIAGCFNVTRSDQLAAPVFNALRSAEIAQPSIH